jgi:F420-dependent oxidoreductase-like protein
MHFRIFTEPQQGARHNDLVAVAQVAEDLGFDAFFRSDHYLKMGSATGLPGPSDAWTTLAGLAVQTSRIRLGTLVTPVTFRNPAQLAMVVAQVDDMSNGRVELGLGAGWYAAEHTMFGIDFPSIAARYERFAEYVEVISRYWATAEGATFDFHGTHYEITDCPGLPKPVQARPPIIIGAKGKPKGLRIAVQHGDEYNVSFRSVEETSQIYANLAAAETMAGRRPLVRSVVQILCLGRDEAEIDRRAAAIGREKDELRHNGLAGTPAEVVAKLRRFADLGVQRTYLQVLDLHDLDHLKLAAEEILPAFH